MRAILAGLLIFSVGGCASSKIAEGAREEDKVSTLKVSCSKPYELTQDCSVLSGAKRKIWIQGHKIKIAGSADGKIVLVMDPHPFLTAAITGATFWLADAQSAENNESFYQVRSLLQAKGVEIIKVVPINSFGSIDGYFLELDKDGYSILKEARDK